MTQERLSLKQISEHNFKRMEAEYACRMLMHLEGKRGGLQAERGAFYLSTFLCVVGFMGSLPLIMHAEVAIVPSVFGIGLLILALRWACYTYDIYKIERLIEAIKPETGEPQ